MAGLDVSKSQSTDGRVGDWVFSQTEIVVREGTLQWTDEMRSLPTLALRHVDLVIRNKLRQHDMRLDATPPVELGERFSLRSEFKQPLLVTEPGQWRAWEGQLFSEFDRVDLAQLQRYVDTGVTVAGGSGALRAWVDMSQGRVTGVTADVALARVGVTLGPQLAPLAMTSLAGRLGAKLLSGGYEVSTRDLQFETEDGLRWPGGNVSLTHIEEGDGSNAGGELRGDRLDLNALTQIAKRLPVSARLHEKLAFYAPKGLVERVHVRWDGPLLSPTRLEARGRLAQLQVAAQPAARHPSHAVGQAQPDAAPEIGSPGVKGAQIDFDLTQAGGHAAIVVRDGWIELPGVFEDPVIALDQLSADVQWQISGNKLSVQSSRMNFSNADAQGELQFKWSTQDAQAASANARFAGVLDLQGSMSRAEGNRVHRYLPLVIDRAVREYLRDAVTAGRASAVRFRVRGDLKDMPFADPKQGEFRITANVHNANFAFVPPSLQAAGDAPWPVLTDFNGEFVFDRVGLELRDVTARVARAPGLRIIHAQARIPELRHAAVQVNLEARGPLDEVLKQVIGETPIGSLAGQMVSHARASGNAEIALKLALPLSELDKSTVQGQVQLTGNELQLLPGMPRLYAAHGVVYFSEKGFCDFRRRGARAGGQCASARRNDSRT